MHSSLCYPNPLSFESEMRDEDATPLCFKLSNRQTRDIKLQICSADLGYVMCGSSFGSFPTLAAEPKLMAEVPLSLRSDEAIAFKSGPSSFLHPTSLYSSSSGLPLQLGLDGNKNKKSSSFFTLNQLRELQHQVLIFKHIMCGLNVPSELIIPLGNTSNIGWGNDHMCLANKRDPELGRCRRTDGKKWCCARNVVPDHKYCERHMHRGTHRAKKAAEHKAFPASLSKAGNSTLNGIPEPEMGEQRSVHAMCNSFLDNPLNKTEHSFLGAGSVPPETGQPLLHFLDPWSEVGEDRSRELSISTPRHCSRLSVSDEEVDPLEMGLGVGNISGMYEMNNEKGELDTYYLGSFPFGRASSMKHSKR